METTTEEITPALKESLKIIESTTVTKEEVLSPQEQGYKNWANRRIATLEKRIDFSETYLSQMLSHIEGIVDSEPAENWINFFDADLAIQYMAAAKHMEGVGRRPHRISEVDAWVNSDLSLPKRKTA